MFIPTIHLVLLVAVTWRLSNLLANEDGPFHFVKTLRSKVARAEVRSRRKKGLISRLHLYEGINCEYCNSIWFGTLLTVFYRLLNPIDLTTTILLPLALSTGAILVKHVVFLLKSADHRLDQQNQAHEAALKEPKVSGLNWEVFKVSEKEAR